MTLGSVLWGAIAGLLAGGVLWLGGRWAFVLSVDSKAGNSAAASRPSTWGWPTRFGCVLVAAAYGILVTDRHGPDGWKLAPVLVVAALLLLVLLIDAHVRLIPTVAVVTVALAGLALAVANGAAWSSVVGGGIGGGLFGLLWLAARPLRRLVGEDPLGSGDVLLAAAIGFVAGWPGVMRALFLGALLAGVYSLFVLAFRRNRRSDPIPYGSFLCLGALVTLLLGL